jgi:hypothetical protein
MTDRMCLGLKTEVGDGGLLEDADGAPYPENVQEFVRWLQVGIKSSAGLVEQEMAKPNHGERDMLVALAATNAAYQEVLAKLKELA